MATPVVALDQVPPASPSELNDVEPFEQTASVPLNVPALTAVLTVALPVATFCVVASVELQVILPPTPFDAPVTTLT